MTVICFFLINRMLHLRGRDTVRISKVKGHADDTYGSGWQGS